MRTRKWILILAGSLVAFVAAGYVSWRLTAANERIKTLILDGVRPYLSEETQIVNMDVRLSSIHFRDVTVVPKDNSFRLEIDEICLGYSLFNLIRYGFVPHRIPHDAIIIRPSLIIRPYKTTSSVSDTSTAVVDLQSIAAEVLGVRRITLVDARIIVEDSTGRRTRLGHDLNGWMHAAPPDSAQIRLDGHIFNSPDENVKIDGRVNLLAGRMIWCNAEVLDSEPAEQLPFILPDYIQVSSGRLDGEITYEKSVGAGGFIRLRDADFRLAQANLVFESIQMDARIIDGGLAVSATVDRFNNSRVTLEGRISSILDPIIDAEISIPEFHLQPFFSVLMNEGAPRIYGNANVRVSVVGPITSPQVSASLSGQGLSIYSIPMDSFKSHVDLSGGQLSFSGAGKQIGSISLIMDGAIDLHSDSLYTNVEVRLNGDASRLFPSAVSELIPYCRLDWGIALKGPIKHMHGIGDGCVVPHFTSGDSLKIFPRLNYQDRSAHLTVHSNGPFEAHGEIINLYSEELAWQVSAQGIERLLLPLTGEGVATYLENVRMAGSFSGIPENWRVEGQGDRPGEMGLRTVVDFSLNSYEDSLRPFNLSGRYYGDDNQPVHWHINAVNKDGRIVIHKAGIEDFIKFKGELPLSTRVPQLGTLALNDFKLSDLHGAFSELLPYSGDLDGGITWSGDIDNPRIRVDLKLGNGSFYSENLYEGEAGFLRENGTFKKFDFELRRNDERLFSGLVTRQKSDSLSGTIVGERVDWGDLVYALTGKKNVLKGRGSVRLNVGGAIDTPVINGELSLENGAVGPFGFKRLVMELADTTSKEHAFPSGLLSIKRGLIERDDDLEILFWGQVAHGGLDQSDISVLARGNVLGLLTDVTSFVKSAKSNGELMMRWGKIREGWTLGSTRFSFNDGALELADVARRIKNIAGRGKLEQERRFLHIEQFEADIGGGRLQVFNEMDVAAPPLTIPNLNIGLGRIHFITDDRGIRLHIPGLMEKDERGWFSFCGKTEDVDFMLTGPSSNPLVHGKFEVSGQRLTYPFLSLGGDGKGANVDFLKELDLDVSIVPMKDVRYFKRINNPVGNVYVDLQLRERLGSLSLNGIIDDGDLSVYGHLVSTGGTIEILDHLFRPERIVFEFPRGADSPFISGRAFTTIIDSLGVPSTVWLNITSVDDETGIEKSGGPWEKVRFRFSTDNPNMGRTEADLMASLGYSTAHFRERAYKALGMQVENRVFRPIFRPIEKGLRRHLGLDVVHVSSMFSRNIFQLNRLSQREWDPWALLRSTKLTLGKYFSPGFFISYSGQIHDGYRYHYPIEGRIGMRHALILEYTIKPDLFLEMEYMYDTQLLSERREDKRIWLRHVFPF
ncbi:hypothetical protein KAR48_03420 [bacterium]|nr:hypothetical protein [bacterium]